MKFFLPVQEAKIAEESYQALKKIIENQTGWPISDRRYYEIHYRHNDRDLHARVGGPDPLNGEFSLRALSASVAIKRGSVAPF